MNIILKINRFKGLIFNNKKIVENYIFMTILQMLNSFFYLLIYPFLIKNLGLESYGLYVFSMSITTYFIFFINFGFELPAIRAVAENIENTKYVSEILSCVFTSKLYLFLLSSIVVIFLVLIIPKFNSNKLLFLICFFQSFSLVIFPQWYFQAVQKMKVVTLIQLIVKLLSLPLILFFINGPEYINIYAFIVTLSTIIGGIIAFFIVRYKYKIKIRIVPFNKLKKWYKDSLPFFLSNSAGIIKEQSIVLIIGTFFNMRDVAIYDLANKIILIPRTIFMSINSAIFPKLIKNITDSKVKKIIKIEFCISILVILLIALSGKYIIEVMGGLKMLGAYPIVIFLSFTILSWLVVGAYISFVFIPNNNYFLVTKNQSVAIVSFICFVSIGIYFFKSIEVFAIAIALSGLTEIIYCLYVSKKYKML